MGNKQFKGEFDPRGKDVRVRRDPTRGAATHPTGGVPVIPIKLGEHFIVKNVKLTGRPSAFFSTDPGSRRRQVIIGLFVGHHGFRSKSIEIDDSNYDRTAELATVTLQQSLLCCNLGAMSLRVTVTESDEGPREALKVAGKVLDGVGQIAFPHAAVAGLVGSILEFVGEFIDDDDEMQYYGTLNDEVTGNLTPGHYSVIRESEFNGKVRTDLAVEFDVETFHPGWEVVRTSKLKLTTSLPSPPNLTTIEHTVVLLTATFQPGKHAHTMEEPVRTSADTAVIAIVGTVQIPLEGNRTVYCPFDVAVRRCNRRGTPDIIALVENFVVYDSLWPAVQPDPDRKMLLTSTGPSTGGQTAAIFGHASVAIESDKLKVASAVLGLIGASVGVGAFGEASEIIEIVGSSVEFISASIDIAKDLQLKPKRSNRRRKQLTPWTLNTDLILPLHDDLHRCSAVTLAFTSRVWTEEV